MSEKSSEGIPGTFRVAALQMVSAPDRERNIAEAGRLIAEAARDGAQLVLLPEYFCLHGFQGHGQARDPRDARPRSDPAVPVGRGARASRMGDRWNLADGIA